MNLHARLTHTHDNELLLHACACHSALTQQQNNKYMKVHCHMGYSVLLVTCSVGSTKPFSSHRVKLRGVYMRLCTDEGRFNSASWYMHVTRETDNVP